MGRKSVCRFAAAVSGVVLVAGCATNYQVVGFTGGFSETQLAENVFQVRFRGNAFTDMERAVDFTLLRSAELALGHGYAYFTVVDDDQRIETSTYTAPTTATTSVNVAGTGSYATGTATTTVYGGQTYVYRKPSADNTIVCYKEPPAEVPVVVEAAFIQRSIRTKYKLVAD